MSAFHLRIRRIVQISLLWAACGSVAAADAPAWKAAAARTTITPTEPMYLSGFANCVVIAEGTAMDLNAKALAIEDAKGARSVMVTLDLVEVAKQTRDAAAAKVKAQFNLPNESLLLNCSHTHCGPEFKFTDAEFSELLGDMEVTALMRKDPMLAKARTFAQWRQLVEQTTMNVYCVAGESGGRVEPLLALIERGVHIVSEKPLVTTMADLARVREAFVKSKSQLTMLMALRHQPKNARVREIIQRGDIGEVCRVTPQKSYKWGPRTEWFGSRQRLGGTIPYIGIHSLHTIRWVTRLDFIHLAAIHSRIGRPEMGETECHASVLGELSNGASVTARIDYLRPAKAATYSGDRLRVVGTKGVVEVNEGDETISLITGDKTERIAFGETENRVVEFVKFLRGGAAPRITADDCFHITEIALPPMRPVRG